MSARTLTENCPRIIFVWGTIFYVTGLSASASAPLSANRELGSY